MRSHVAALDGLRGIAVAAVVAYHLRPEWAPGGFLGVDLFFVLSGYLITSLLLDERTRSGAIDLISFAGRRLRRLLPAVLIVVVAVVAYEAIAGDAGRVEQVRRHAVATLAYTANWVFIVDGDSYFADVAGPSMFRHMWSLAIEEQCYLVWPATVLVVLRFGGRRAVGSVAAITGMVSIVLMASHFDAGDPSRAYFGTDTRIFEPLIGALGAAVWPLRAEKPRWLAPVGAVAGVGWLAAVFAIDDEWGGFYQGGAVVLGAMGLLAVIGATRPGSLARLTGTPPLVGLGTISYAVYLWHWPILLMLRRAGWTGYIVDVTVVVLTVTLSTVSYLLVERPIRRAGRTPERLAHRWRPIGAALASVLLVGVVVVVAMRTTVPAEATTVDEVIAALSAPADRAAPDDTGMDARPVTIVLIGDSSAWTLGGGLVTAETDQGPYSSPFDPDQITLVNLARKGYRLLLDRPAELFDVGEVAAEDLEDEAFWMETVTAVRPDLIVALFGLSDLQERAAEGAAGELDPPDLAALLASPGAVLLDTLADTAPVMVLATPRLVAADMPQPEIAALFETASHSQTDLLNDLLAEIAASDPRIGFLDFGGWLCPLDGADVPLRDGCRTTVDGEPVRYDGVHFTEAGAAMASEWLTGPLLAAAGSSP